MLQLFTTFQPHPKIACTSEEFNPKVHKAIYRCNYPAMFEAFKGMADKDIRSVLRDLIRNDRFFVAYFVANWEDKNLSGNKPYIVNLCREMEDGPDDGTIDIHAREHGKSAVITIAGTVQRIVRDPECCTVFFSYKKGAADKFLDSVRKILEMPFMTWCFPDILYEKPETQSPSWSLQGGIRVKRQSTSRREHTVEAYGLAEGMPTGGHYDHRVYDDIETEDMAKSPDQMSDCFKKLLMSRYLGREGGTEQVIGTYYSHLGVLVQLAQLENVDKTPAFILRLKPGTEDGTINGKPVFFSQKYLDSKKIDIKAFNTQILCNPTPAAEVKLHFDRFQTIHRDKLPKNRVKFMIVDPAGDKDVQAGIGNDKWAMGVVSVRPVIDDLGLSDVYIEDGICREMSISEAQDAAVGMYARNGRILMLGVERVATDSAWLHIKNALAARGRYLELHKKGQFGGNLVLLSPAGRSKNYKIESNLSWPLNNGKLHFVEGINPEIVEECKQECDKFPFFHVDFIDMLSYLYDILSDPTLPLYFSEEDEDEDPAEEETPKYY